MLYIKIIWRYINGTIYFPYVKVTRMNKMYDGDDMCVIFLILLYNVHCPV